MRRRRRRRRLRWQRSVRDHQAMKGGDALLPRRRTREVALRVHTRLEVEDLLQRLVERAHAAVVVRHRLRRPTHRGGRHLDRQLLHDHEQLDQIPQLKEMVEGEAELLDRAVGLLVVLDARLEPELWPRRAVHLGSHLEQRRVPHRVLHLRDDDGLLPIHQPLHRQRRRQRVAPLDQAPLEELSQLGAGVRGAAGRGAVDVHHEGERAVGRVGEEVGAAVAAELRPFDLAHAAPAVALGQVRLQLPRREVEELRGNGRPLGRRRSIAEGRRRRRWWGRRRRRGRRRRGWRR